MTYYESKVLDPTNYKHFPFSTNGSVLMVTVNHELANIIEMSLFVINVLCLHRKGR